MNETLYKLGKGLPVVGPLVQAAYIGARVKVLLQKAKDSKDNEALREKSGEELDEALADIANDMYEEDITPLVVQEGIPAEVEKPIREKAVEELIAVLRQKVLK